MVPLMEFENELAWAAAASVDVPDNVYGTEVRDRELKVHTLVHALRRTENPDTRVFDTADELKAELDVPDINHLIEEYDVLIEYSSPAIDGLSEDQVGELKKGLEEIDWNALSGKAWHHLKAFYLTLTVDQLRAKSRSDSFIQNLTGTSEESVFTPGAEES